MKKQSLGVIGTGAFGSFMAKHLAPHFALVLHDSHKNTKRLAKEFRGKSGSLSDAASCKIVIIAVPVQQIERVLRGIAKIVKPGALVIDVGSVKMKPAKLMREILPGHVDIVGTHPLFGPQSGKKGVKGLNIAVCAVRGKRGACVERFCRSKLGLSVHAVSPRDHDRELAYVQGLTHLLAKVVISLNLPKFRLTTKTYDLMDQMIEMVRYDSDDLFRAIERENPFTKKAKKDFFWAARQLEQRLARPGIVSFLIRET